MTEIELVPYIKKVSKEVAEDRNLYRKDQRQKQIAVLKTAFKELGVEEIPGKRNNKRIVEYHQATSLKAEQDSVPWCASFMNWCLEQHEIKGTYSARSRSFTDWGANLHSPEFGCITVLSRGPNPLLGHVGFFIHQTKDEIYLLGGNQSDKVCIKPYDKDRLISYRGIA